MTDEPNQSDIEALREEINNGPWEVTDYEFEGGMYEPFTVTIEAEWSPKTEELFFKSPDEREEIQTVRDVVEELQTMTDEGAPIDDVVQRCVEEGFVESRIQQQLEQLRRQGDVYEPATDHLRVV